MAIPTEFSCNDDSAYNKGKAAGEQLFTLLRSDIIWCLSGGVRVYAQTQKGEMPMTIKDMARLDPKTVKLWNGEKWTQLLGVSRTARTGEEVEIQLRSGEKISCTRTHKFPTTRGLIDAGEIVVGDILQSCQLPEPKIPSNPYSIPNDIGWLVGLYLAEGSRDTGGTIQIARHVDEYDSAEQCQRIVSRFGGTYRWHELGGKTAVLCIESSVVRAIIDLYITGHTARDKHLTTRAWQRNNTFLDFLIRGYLEGDGHYDRQNDRWRLGFTSNYNLANDLRTLCARLGYQITVNLATANIGDKVYDTFRGEIRFSATNHVNSKNRNEVVAINKARAREFYDLGVENDPHLFALASGILTHNSKPNPMPESVTDRPTKSHEYIFPLSKSERYYFDQDDG